MASTHPKIYRISLVLLLLAATAHAQDTIGHTAGLNGRIKTLTEYNYATEGGDNGVDAGDRAYKVVKLFDEEGNCYEEQRYGADGFIVGRIAYKYHKLSGRLIEERNYDATDKYKYSEHHHYDPRGNEIMRKSVKPDKIPFLKVTMEYDEQNNILQEKTASPGGRVLSRAMWKYDERNNPIEEVTYDPDQGETRRSVYKYDERNYLVEEKNTYYGLTVRTTYKWDSAGHLLEECNYNAEQRMDKLTKHMYDQRGDETEQQLFTGDGTMLKAITFGYTYDGRDNLVKKIQSENNREIILVQREIVYY